MLNQRPSQQHTIPILSRLLQLFQGVDVEPGGDEETTGRPAEEDDLSDLYQTIDLSEVINDRVQGTLEELNENLVLSEKELTEPEKDENHETAIDKEKQE